MLNDKHAYNRNYFNKLNIKRVARDLTLQPTGNQQYCIGAKFSLHARKDVKLLRILSACKKGYFYSMTKREKHEFTHTSERVNAISGQSSDITNFNASKEEPKVPVGFARLLASYAVAKWEQEQNRLVTVERVASNIAQASAEVQIISDGERK